MATEYGGLPALVIFLGFFLGSGRFFSMSSAANYEAECSNSS